MKAIHNISTTKSGAVQPLPSILRAPGEGEIVTRDGASVTIKTPFSGTAGALAVSELRIAPGQGIRVHCHPEADEIIFVMEGRLQVFQGTQTWAGDCGHNFQIAAGATHGLYNAGEVPVRAMVYHVATETAQAALWLDPAMLAVSDGKTVARAIVEGGIGGVRALGMGEGERANILGNWVQFLVDGTATDGRFFLFSTITAPGSGVPPHQHNNEDELFYVLDGAITFMLPDGTETVGEAGTFLVSPAGTPHAWYNRTDRTARLVIATTPAGFENFFRAIDGVTDSAQVIATAAEFDIPFLPPPAR